VLFVRHYRNCWTLRMMFRSRIKNLHRRHSHCQRSRLVALIMAEHLKLGMLAGLAPRLPGIQLYRMPWELLDQELSHCRLSVSWSLQYAASRKCGVLVLQYLIYCSAGSWQVVYGGNFQKMSVVDWVERRQLDAQYLPYRRHHR
jgi:hypothetical protein